MDIKSKYKNFRLSLWLIAGLMAYSQSGISAPQLFCGGSPCSATDNYFGALGDYFEKGSQPHPAVAKGWFSGRCYTRNLTSRAFGGLLVIENHALTSQPTDANGPLFPAQPPETHLINITSVVFGDVTIFPDNYDSLTANVETEISNQINMPGYQKHTVSTINGSLVSINNDGNVRYEVRKYDDYFISQAVILRYSSFYAPGEIHSRCYFFKKIKDVK